MPNATANRMALRYIAEVTAGTTPDNPALTELRYTGETLDFDRSSVTSKEIRDDRMTSDLVAVKASSGGDLNIEFSAEAFDDFIEAAFCGTWGTASKLIENCEDAWNESVDSDVTVTTDLEILKFGRSSVKLAVAAGATAGDILATEAILSTDLSACVSIKMWIRSSVNTAQGDLRLLLDNTANCASPLEDLQIPALTANTWTEVTLPLADAANDTAIISIGLKMQIDIGACDIHLDDIRAVYGAEYTQVKNGTTNRAFTIQKHYQDTTPNVFVTLRGQRVSDMALDFKVGSILTGKFGFLGRDVTPTTSQITGATIVNASTNTPMNAVSNLQQIQENGVTAVSAFRSLTLNLNNNMREQEAIGNLFPIDVVPGTLEITGNLEAYFSEMALYQRFIDDEHFSVGFKTVDGDGNHYEWLMPRVKVESAKMESGGIDTDVMISGSWRAIYDPNEDCMIKVIRRIVA